MSRWRWIGIALLLLLLVAGLWRLRFDVEVLNLLPSNSQVVRGLKLYQRNFSNARELIITVRGSSAEETESASHAVVEALRGQTGLVSRVTWQPPWLENPAESAELIAYMWLNQPPAAFSELIVRLT